MANKLLKAEINPKDKIPYYLESPLILGINFTKIEGPPVSKTCLKFSGFLPTISQI